MVKHKQETIKNILIDIRRMLRWFLSGEGAIVTLTLLIIAAIVGFLIQDAIQKQRYLELLQLELRMNFSNANTEIKNVENGKYLTTHLPISTSVYNAGLQQGYILTLDPSTQAHLFSLYSTLFPLINNYSNHNMDIITQYETQWEDCEDNSIASSKSDTQCAQLKQAFLDIQKQYSIYIVQGDAQEAKDISQFNFNPTEERLHPTTLEGFLLRLLMGDKSLKIQQ